MIFHRSENTTEGLEAADKILDKIDEIERITADIRRLVELEKGDDVAGEDS